MVVRSNYVVVYTKDVRAITIFACCTLRNFSPQPKNDCRQSCATSIRRQLRFAGYRPPLAAGLGAVCQRGDEESTRTFVGGFLLQQSLMQVAKSLLQSLPLRLRLHQQRRLSPKLIPKRTFHVLCGLLRVPKHSSTGF